MEKERVTDGESGGSIDEVPLSFTDYMDSPDLYCYFGAYPFLLFSFSVLHFLVVVSCGRLS